MHPGADLIVTEGQEGGLLVRVGTNGPREILRYRSTASDREADQTGAGDTFIARPFLFGAPVIGRER